MSEAVHVRAVNPGFGHLKSRTFEGRVGVRDRGGLIEIGFFGKRNASAKLPERATLDGEIIRILSVTPRVPDNQAPSGMPRSYVAIAEREGRA